MQSYAELCRVRKSYADYESYAKLCKLTPIYATLCIFMQIYQMLCRILQSYSELCRIMQSHAMLYKVMQRKAKLWKVIQRYVKLLYTLPNVYDFLSPWLWIADHLPGRKRRQTRPKWQRIPDKSHSIQHHFEETARETQAPPSRKNSPKTFINFRKASPKLTSEPKFKPDLAVPIVRMWAYSMSYHFPKIVLFQLAP